MRTVGLLTLAFLTGCTDRNRPPLPRAAGTPPAVNKRVEKASVILVTEVAQTEPAITFPNDEAGKQLQERLTPPRTVLPLPVPFVTEPQPRRLPTLDQLPLQLRPLPLAETRTTALPLPGDRLTVSRPRPVLDFPPLAAETYPVLPTLSELPTGPRAVVAGPDPRKPSPLSLLALPQPEQARPASDPTLESSRQAALKVISLLRERPVPFLRPAVPDPFEHLRAVQLRNRPPDDDAPATSNFRQPPPALPVKP